MIYGRMKGCKYFMGIMAAAVELPNIIITPVAHQRLKFWRIKNDLTHIGTILGLHGLILAVDDFAKPLHQDAFFVAGKQSIPMTAPNDLNDVPA